MKLKEIREIYPEGTQIVLTEMAGESQMPYGLKGTVKFVDDAGQIHMSCQVERKWYVVDAADKTLGRLAAEVAKILRGKHKPTFTPHMDTGDHVIVINADKVVLTGKKLVQKTYFRHSGYLGGASFTTAGEMLAKNPVRMVELAVKGMIPHNRLGSRIFTKLIL